MSVGAAAAKGRSRARHGPHGGQDVRAATDVGAISYALDKRFTTYSSVA